MGGQRHEGDRDFEVRRLLRPRAVLGFHPPFAVAGIENISPEVAKLLLQYEAGAFLYIDTVDRAGRWDIPREGAGPLQLRDGLVLPQDRARLNGKGLRMHLNGAAAVLSAMLGVCDQAL